MQRYLILPVATHRERPQPQPTLLDVKQERLFALTFSSSSNIQMPRKLSLKRRRATANDFESSSESELSDIDNLLEQCTAPSSSASWCGYHPATAVLLVSCAFLAVLALRDTNVSFHVHVHRHNNENMPTSHLRRRMLQAIADSAETIQETAASYLDEIDVVETEDDIYHNKDSSVAGATSNKASSPGNSPVINAYSTPTIVHTQQYYIPGRRNSILFFNGQTGTFQIYVDGQSGQYASIRNRRAVYLLVDALRAHHPERFSLGQPNLQILLNTDDYPTTRCLSENGNDGCAGVDNLAPQLNFGSVPKDASLLGNAIQSMPLTTYLPCVAVYRFQRNILGKCSIPSSLDRLEYNTATKWEDLKPQVYWRGTDWAGFLSAFNLQLARGIDVMGSATEHFESVQDVVDALHKYWDVLTPRWRAVTMAIEAQAEVDAEKKGHEDDAAEDDEESLPWIDARFTVKQDGGESAAVYRPFLHAHANVVTTTFSDDSIHAQHRYQIDIGGGGGTSWTGTLSKLLMPGLLFHHETLTKDFFYDEMKPYVHYIPVKQDLSDLKQRFDWAESNPKEAQAIAKAGTELALRLGSDEYIRELYDELFVQHVGKVIDSYQAQEGETVESILAAYEEAGVPMKEYGECDASECRWGDDGSVRPYVTGVASLKKKTGATSDEVVSATE